MKMNMSSTLPIRFIEFDDFIKLGRIPRFPDDANIVTTCDKIQREDSLIVFISHCWLRGIPSSIGWDGSPHPDDASKNKFTLCVNGIKDLLKSAAPRIGNCYLWIDFGCVNQEGNIFDEINYLDKIIEFCDCIFTPVHDENYSNWEFPSKYNSLYEVYGSSGWKGTDFSYLARGWCRLEMVYAATIPILKDSEERVQKFARGFMFHRMNNIRPHFLYGTKEMKAQRFPRVLPPLQYSYFQKYPPEKGNFSEEKDRPLIESLVRKLLPHIRKTEPVYQGEEYLKMHHGYGKYTSSSGYIYEGYWRNNLRDGFGICQYLDGNKYVGLWKNDLKHGFGCCYYCDGNSYEGKWREGERHGKGISRRSNGNYYIGDFEHDRKQGKGISLYLDGSYYCGDFLNNKRHGVGTLCSGDGTIHEGEWENDKKIH